MQRDVTGRIYPQSDLLVLLPSPGQYEAAQGSLSSKSNILLLSKLPPKTSVDYIVQRTLKTVAGNELFPKNYPNYELQLWYEDVKRRVAEIKPKVVLATGDLAIGLVDSLRTNMDSVKGYVYDLEWHGHTFKLIPCYDPAGIFKEDLREFWLDFCIAKSQKLLDGDYDRPFDLEISNDVTEAIASLKRILASKQEVSIDIETTGDSTRKLRSIGWTEGPDCGYAISDKLELILPLIKQIMESPDILKIGQNFIFDAQVLYWNHGIRCVNPVWDTMHCNKLLYPELKSGLETLAAIYHACPPFKGGWHFYGTALREYNALDCIYTHRIKTYQDQLLTEGNRGIWNSTSMPLWQHAFEMSTLGIRVDNDLRKQFAKELGFDTSQGMDNIKKLAKTTLLPVEKEMKAYVEERKLLGPKEKVKHPRDWENDIPVADAIVPEDKRKKAADYRKWIQDHLHVTEKDAKGYFVHKGKKLKTLGGKPGQVYKGAYRKEITLVPQTFNPASSTQIMEIMRNRGFEPPKVKNNKGEFAPSGGKKATDKLLTKPDLPADFEKFLLGLKASRSARQLIKLYIGANLRKISDDYRWTCSYKIEGTETGRSSSATDAHDFGGNNQNQPRATTSQVNFKNIFVPDDGYELVQFDQSGAEARLVAYLAGNKTIIDLMNAGGDIHMYTAALLTGRSYESLMAAAADKGSEAAKEAKHWRTAAKPIRHGGHYIQGAGSVQESALTYGLVLSREEAEDLLKKFHEGEPQIKGVFHEYIRNEIQTKAMLTTPFGRERIFFKEFNHSNWRKGCAFIPQSTVPHVTNLMWLWAVRSEFCKSGDVQMLQMGHDGLLFQAKPVIMDQFSAAFIKASEQVRFDIGDFKNVFLPWDAERGLRWGEMTAMEVKCS